MEDLNEQEPIGRDPLTDAQKRKKYIIKEIYSIILIVVGVFAFRSTFYEPFRIPTGSMIPTLMIGDFIVVDKWAYGFKVPFSDMFSDPVYITSPSKPEHGDVIVFKYPKKPSINYIKRVIGVPGDEIEIIDKVVYVNGKAIEGVSVPGKEIFKDMDEKFQQYSFDFYKMKTGDHTHIIQTERQSYNKATVPALKVPEGRYFVMGDNRDFSADSRWWGFVPFENIKGKARFIWFSMRFPWDENGFKLRFHRIGHLIDWWQED